MNKCLGCGVLLQTENPKLIGYAQNENDKLCQRCFKIKNYNDYKIVNNNNDKYISILNQINDNNDLVLVIVDFLNLKDLELIKRYLYRKFILVLTKKDLLPRSVSDDKILSYFGDDYLDKIFISSYKNYHLDQLIELINKYKTSNNVYLVGGTNAGKSTLINKMIYNYTNDKSMITTSILPSTTLESIKIKLNNLNVIDTPGLINEESIINYLEPGILKKVIPNKEIKPITFQIKTEQTLLIDDLVKIKTENTNLTLFVSNNLKIERKYKNLVKGTKFKLKKGQDLVIEGLGFIKVSKDCSIDIECLPKVSCYIRNSLI